MEKQENKSRRDRFVEVVERVADALHLRNILRRDSESNAPAHEKERKSKENGPIPSDRVEIPGEITESIHPTVGPDGKIVVSRETSVIMPKNLSNDEVKAISERVKLPPPEKEAEGFQTNCRFDRAKLSRWNCDAWGAVTNWPGSGTDKILHMAIQLGGGPQVKDAMMEGFKKLLARPYEAKCPDCGTEYARFGDDSKTFVHTPNDKDGVFKCTDCGSQAVSVIMCHSVYFLPTLEAGFGQVMSYARLFCPNCEEDKIPQPERLGGMEGARYAWPITTITHDKETKRIAELAKEFKHVS